MIGTVTIEFQNCSFLFALTLVSIRQIDQNQTDVIVIRLTDNFNQIDIIYFKKREQKFDIFLQAFIVKVRVLA